MRVVIEISEHTYNSCCALADIDGSPILKAIKNGTVLPEQHGRLIDADFVNNKLREHHDFYLSAYDNDFKHMPIDVKARCDEIIESIAEIVNAPTILEGTVKE